MSSVRVVVQTRTDSSRLPGKAFLAIQGLPIAALCCLRARSEEFEVVAATSDEPTDDALAAMLARYGLSVSRGAKDDVLSRFVAACAGLPDDAVVVRLTADNPFVDADLVRLAVQALDADVEYVAPFLREHGLPYGMGVEAFRARSLRETDERAHEPADREHVTTWLRRNARTRGLTIPDAPFGWRALRCTVDALDDYLRVVDCFGDDDPLTTSWRTLVERLAERHSPPHWVAESKFVLGTAQLGMAYGSVRPEPPPAIAEAIEIVRTAVECGVDEIDTASAYGESETRIGFALTESFGSRTAPITKADPLVGSVTDPVATVEASVLRSLHRLRRSSLPVVLLHRAAHLDAWDGAVWRALLRLRDEGLIGRLGVSVQSPDELKRCLAEPAVEHVQLPFNVLDRRWRGSEAFSARPDVRVHVRSAFLQGVLLRPAPAWPDIPGTNPHEVLAWLQAMASAHAGGSVGRLCAGYVCAQPWVHGVVVGVHSLAQLLEMLAVFEAPALSEHACAEIEATRPTVPEPMLDPAQWPRESHVRA